MKKGTLSPLRTVHDVSRVSQLVLCALTVEDKVCHHQGHQRALGVVQEESIAEPALGLETRTLFTFFVLLGCKVRREMFGEVFGDESRLGKDQWLRSSRRRYANDGGFAQRVHLLQLGRCKHLGCALVDLNAEVDVALFKKPYKALGS